MADYQFDPQSEFALFAEDARIGRLQMYGQRRPKTCRFDRDTAVPVFHVEGEIALLIAPEDVAYGLEMAAAGKLHLPYSECVFMYYVPPDFIGSLNNKRSSTVWIVWAQESQDGITGTLFYRHPQKMRAYGLKQRPVHHSRSRYPDRQRPRGDLGPGADGYPGDVDPCSRLVASRAYRADGSAPRRHGDGRAGEQSLHRCECAACPHQPAAAVACPYHFVFIRPRNGLMRGIRDAAKASPSRRIGRGVTTARRAGGWPPMRRVICAARTYRRLGTT